MVRHQFNLRLQSRVMSGMPREGTWLGGFFFGIGKTFLSALGLHWTLGTCRAEHPVNGDDFATVAMY